MDACHRRQPVSVHFTTPQTGFSHGSGSHPNLACAQVEEFKQNVSARADVATEVGLGSSQLFSISVANDFREVRSILSEKQIMRLRQLANQSALFLGDLVNAVRSSVLEQLLQMLRASESTQRHKPPENPRRAQSNDERQQDSTVNE